MLRPQLLVVLALLPALVACNASGAASARGQAPAPGARMTPTPQAASIAASREQTFTVVLEGHGTAGYEWSLAPGYDARVVRPKGEKRLGELGPNPLPGNSAAEIFEFQALAAGQATLVFELKRPWEATAEEQRRITVTVR